jgi:rRNA maturation protein Rpf1
VRTFIRDLHSVIPGSDRFNRGSMSILELVSRIRQQEARGAFVISSFRGNPRILQIVLPSGDISYELIIESGLLRREVDPKKRLHVKRLVAVGTLGSRDESVQRFSKMFADLLDIEFRTLSSQDEVVCGSSLEAIMVFWSDGEKVMWSTFHTKDGQEIGPRVRLTGLQSDFNE